MTALDSVTGIPQKLCPSYTQRNVPALLPKAQPVKCLPQKVLRQALLCLATVTRPGALKSPQQEKLSPRELASPFFRKFDRQSWVGTGEMLI